MKSATRNDCEFAVDKFMTQVRKSHAQRQDLQMLYVGTAGNPLTHNGKPGPDQPELFTNYNITTCDFDKKWNPDIVMDITNPHIDYFFKYDLIVMTQTIEHIPNIFELQSSIRNLLSKTDSYLLIDCPWNYPYHGEPPSFGDYWRISKDGFNYLFNKMHMVDCISTPNNVSCLFSRNM
jgi:hypothetical protein